MLFVKVLLTSAEDSISFKISKDSGNLQLLENSQILLKFSQLISVEFIFEKANGGHDWDFWDTYIQNVLNWLPLGNK